MVYWDYVVVNHVVLCDNCVAKIQGHGWVVENVKGDKEYPCESPMGLGRQCGRPGRMRLMPLARLEEKNVHVTREQYYGRQEAKEA